MWPQEERVRELMFSSQWENKAMTVFPTPRKLSLSVRFKCDYKLEKCQNGSSKQHTYYLQRKLEMCG